MATKFRPEWIARFEHLAVSRECRAAPLPKGIWHYTSAAGVIGIVSSGELWATDLAYLNDSSEILYGFSRVREAIHNRQGFVARYLRGWFDEFAFGKDPIRGGLAPCGVVCFCTEKDLLSQWRGYATFGAGYSIGFDAELLAPRQRKVRLHPVVYDESKQDAWINAILTEADQIAVEEGLTSGPDQVALGRAVLSELYLVSILFKSRAFEEEREWRLIRFPSIISKGNSMPAPNSNCGFRPSPSGMIVPYYKHPIRNSDNTLPIIEVTVGPGLDFESARDSIQMLFSTNNRLVLPSIRASAITFRQ